MSRFVTTSRGQHLLPLLLRSALGTAVLLLAFGVMATTPAKADVMFTINTTFNGTSPTSTPPYFTAKFKDIVAGTVELTLTASLTVSSEFIDQVAFNVRDTGTAIDPSDLSIVQTPAVNPLGTPTNTNQDAQNLIGGGALGKDFDIKIDWSAAAGPGRFDGSDVVTFTITGTATAAGLLAADFLFKNGGGANAFKGAHIQGIPVPGGGTTSGAVKDDGTIGPGPAVPEPSSVVLLTLGSLVSLAAYRHRRRS